MQFDEGRLLNIEIGIKYLFSDESQISLECDTLCVLDGEKGTLEITPYVFVIDHIANKMG